MSAMWCEQTLRTMHANGCSGSVFLCRAEFLDVRYVL